MEGIKKGIFSLPNLFQNPSWFDILFSKAWMEDLAHLNSCRWDILKFRLGVWKTPQTQYAQNDSTSPRVISVQDVSELSISHARNLRLSSPYFSYPTYPQLLLVSASRNLTYPFLTHSLLPSKIAMIQAVNLSYLDTCNGLLTSLLASSLHTLFLHMVTRELFKIPTESVTLMLRPFCAFPLLLRCPSCPTVICPCLLLWPYLSSSSLLSRHIYLCVHVQDSSVLEALWGGSLSSLKAPNPVSTPTPLPHEILLFFLLGWLAHSWGTWSS